MSGQPLLALFPTLAGAALVVLAGGRRPWARMLAAAAAGLALAGAVAMAWRVAGGGKVAVVLGGWARPYGIEMVADPISAFVSLLVASIGFAAILYAGRGWEDKKGSEVPFFALALLLLTALQGMTLAGDMFTLYVFLEIASISAYALLAAGGRRAPVATFRYLLLGSVAGVLYLLGLGFLFVSTGTLNMADLSGALLAIGPTAPVVAGATLILVGLGIKMALFPFHSWLPDAYTHAPIATAALIAPLMTKVAAYSLLRFALVLGPLWRETPLPDALGWLGAAGVLFASAMAVSQRDLARMLAWSSVVQIGIIAIGIAVGSPLALAGALLHMLNHAAMKGCLFMAVGNLKQRLGAVRVSDLSGLWRLMPWTAAAFLVAAFSMVGLPPLAGFFSKWYLVLASAEAGAWPFVVAILLSSLMSAVYFFRAAEGVLFGDPPPGAAPREAPAGMLAPTLALALMVVFGGLLHGSVLAFLRPGVPGI
ncbi:NADH/ubiquinone/plastoquinone (complex I) [bacterium]|nr:NADH/ubiquinone/plastoquinone (complex I) [bacterium]